LRIAGDAVAVAGAACELFIAHAALLSMQHALKQQRNRLAVRTTIIGLTKVFCSAVDFF
jgi:hypothetical protein